MNEVIQFLIRHGYSVLFIWVFVNQLGLPIPITPTLLVAGAMAGMGRLNFALVLSVSMVASLLSDLFLYQMGRLRGGKVLSLLCRTSLDPDSCVGRTKGIFARHGARSLLIIKFIPGMNPFGSSLAGIFRMHLLRFFVFDGLGSFFWIGVFAGVGYQFSRQIEYFAAPATRYGSWIGGIIPMIFATYIFWKYIQRKRFFHQLAVARISPEEVKQKLDTGENLMILDLRNALEFDAEPHTIPGAFHLPIEQLEGNHHKIPRDRDIILFCT
ncbi:MAG: VTT domain-containing protein [Thermodesulfobacteriota bacterium]